MLFRSLDATYILFSEELNSSVILLVLLSEIILKAMIVFAGLQVLFRSRGCSVEMTTGKLIIYGVAATFTGIATVLGMMLFVIPGIVVMAASFFMPIYILKENQGPIEAIASGASLMQGRIFRVTLLLGGVWLAIYAIEYVISSGFEVLPFSSVLINVAATCLFLIIGLVTLPIMVNLMAYLADESGEKSGLITEGLN